MVPLEHAQAVNIPTRVISGQTLPCTCLYTQRLAPLTEPSFQNQFIQMRTESHRSPGLFQQLYLLFCVV
jgi:hypothetical protein